MKKALILLGLFFLITSCDTNAIYSKTYTDFDHNRWLAKDVKTFEFEIHDELKPYTLDFVFSHVYEYQFKSVPIQIQITDPSGKAENQTIDLPIKDDSGKELADCSGDICDLSYPIKEKTTLEKGAYKVVVSQAFKGPFLPNVLGVGFKVQVVK